METIVQSVHNFKHILHLVLVFLFLSSTMNRLLFDRKARVHLKEIVINEVTDFQLKMGSFTNIIQRFCSLLKNICSHELNNLLEHEPLVRPKLMLILDTSLLFQMNSKN